ncbi:hypothetical protein ACFQL1_00880 [Halomicroarcula sp. GCM10025709]|uniref:hypothetical protein n=1 Tax=Halomicroarcula sp. GCM10025709 TaxID=3252669 RepID=UPI00361E0E8A
MVPFAYTAEAENARAWVRMFERHSSTASARSCAVDWRFSVAVSCEIERTWTKLAVPTRAMSRMTTVSEMANLAA